ncbi:acyltransferase [Candidatus Saccharibacteria bacterium]|nr:acyltransferase [Candidatus Saccharibacteria bacterium]
MVDKLDYFWKKKTLLSFIAVIFVIIIHNSATGQYNISTDFFTTLTYNYRNIIAYGLGSIAVPLFFFLSGFTMFRNYTLKHYPSKLKTRAKSLLLPYLIWNIISLLFIILCTYTPLANYISGREIFTPSTNNILEGIFLYKYNFQFWFLYDLIIYTLLTPLTYFLIKNKYLGALSSIIILFLPTLFTSLLHLNLNFTIFYFLGCYCGKHYLNLFALPSSKKTVSLSCLLFFIFLILKILLNFGILSPPSILPNIILIGLLFSFWFFSDCFIQKLQPKKYTAETFPIYTLHTYFLAAIIKTIYLLGPKTTSMLFFNEIISSLLTVIIVTLIAYYWHKKLPRIYSFMFGAKTSS